MAVHHCMLTHGQGKRPVRMGCQIWSNPGPMPSAVDTPLSMEIRGLTMKMGSTGMDFFHSRCPLTDTPFTQPTTRS